MASPTFSGVAELAHRIDDLETRVRQLEDRLAAGVTAPTFHSETAFVPEPVHELRLQEVESLIPLLGKALLALAGAYLLRALATSSFAPPLAGVALALAYATFWMYWATRQGASNKLAGVFYMTTAVLALAPMLWETTVRFRMLSSGGAAAALAGFVILSLLLSWKRRISAIAWLAAAAGGLTALALAAGTDDLLPFSAALLTMAVGFEVAATQDLWAGPGRLLACAADLALLWLVYIYSLRPNVPEDYQPISELAGWAVPAALLSLYAAGTVVRTVVRKREVTAWEIFQLLASLTLFLFAATRGPGSRVPLGEVLVFTGAACYGVSFGWLIRTRRMRNLAVYSMFGFALTLLGSSFLLPSAGMSIAWASLAAGFAVLAARTAGLAADYHGLAFLAAAGLVSGLAADTFSVLLGESTRLPLTAAELFVFAAIVAAYVLLRGIPRAIAAVMLAWVITACAAAAFLPGLGASADPAWGAAVRTVLLIVSAVVVAAIGHKWQRSELYWLAPGAMVIALYRLIAEDFRLGRPETLFLSLLFYGGALLVLSRLMRGWRRA